MFMKQPVKLSLIFGLFLFAVAYANAADLNQTQSQLNDLEKKIAHLQTVLNQTQNKKAVLNRELAKTDKQISASIQQLHTIHRDLDKNKQQLNALNKKNDQLSQQLKKEQQLLAAHLRARYKMGEYQPLKWLLNQESPHFISQLLTYYQYLVQSHVQTISSIQAIKIALLENQTDLSAKRKTQKKLEKQFTSRKKQLQADKTYQTQLINKLNNDIHYKQNTLAEYNKNKQNLTHLLQNLLKKSVAKTTTPFSRLRHKLPIPVKALKKESKQINQGVMFFAEEGSPVQAVYPGQVVFSDWLKGYGLLIIIDHGRGYMTLYAYNQSLFKQTGDIVDKGSQIATVGHSGGLKKNGLYFEVRYRGKAVSPLDWLS